MSARLRRALQAVSLLAAVGGVVWLWSSGLLSEVDIALLRQLIAASGAWGPAIYLLLFGLLQPVGLSAHVLVPAAALAWPPGMAIGMAWLGSMLAATVAFAATRTFARGAVAQRVPSRLRRWDEALSSRGFQTVLVLRLIFWTTFLVQLMFGLSQVRWRDYLLGTALGNLPVIVLEVVFIEQVLDWLGVAG
jgi:uncharacterized membrane protein YdjX (TVP38/TMEM64 family)